MHERNDEVMEFFTMHQEKLLGFLIRMGLGLHDAEDTLNDCFLAIWTHWGSIRDNQHRAYLYRIARNEICRRWNTKGRRVEDLVWDAPEGMSADFAAQVIDRETVRWALLRLPRQERIAVILRHYVGCSVAETAMIMGIKPGSVKRYTADGCQKLRKELTRGPSDGAAAGGS